MNVTNSFFFLVVKRFMITKIPIVEIQNVIVDLKYRSYQFLFTHVSRKNQWQIFCHRQISEYYGQKDHAHFRPPPTKSSAYSKNSFLRYSQFLSPETRVATPILDHANRNIFQFLICTNLYEHSKNQVFSSFCSRVDLKILRYD